MELFTTHWPSVKILLQRALIGVIAGVIFSVLIVNWQMQVALNGALIGALISLYTSLLDQFLIATRLRRRPFWIVLIVRTISYFAGILLIIIGVYLIIIGLFSKLATFLGDDANFPLRALVILIGLVALTAARRRDEQLES